MEEIAVVGLDLAKNVFQVHGVRADGGMVVRRQIRRGQMLIFFSSVVPCLVGIDAMRIGALLGSELMALGNQVRLMPPAYVKAYVKRGKTDAARTEAIAEAVTRPTMRLSR
jgi:transposase